MRFAKLHGLGNSYVYLDLVSQPLQDGHGIDWPELARRVSDPGFGIGSDGLILILPSARADLRMRMFNADGSEGEMCGNGIRALARYAADAGLIQGNRLRIETPAGVLPLELDRRGGTVTAVRVDMGEPRLRRSEIPIVLPPPAWETGARPAALPSPDPAAGRAARKGLPGMAPAGMGPEQDGPVIDQPLPVGGRVCRVTAVSMGNPHCVLLVDDVDQAPVQTLGPQVETHAAFPRGVNVEFVQVMDPANVRMRVWERGSGETNACGTGACAAAVAAALLHRTGRRVSVHMRGGQLDIEWAPDNHVYMSGPCEPICFGELSAEWLRARLPRVGRDSKRH